jgi:hypothetical protein
LPSATGISNWLVWVSVALTSPCQSKKLLVTKRQMSAGGRWVCARVVDLRCAPRRSIELIWRKVSTPVRDHWGKPFDGKAGLCCKSFHRVVDLLCAPRRSIEFIWRKVSTPMRDHWEKPFDGKACMCCKSFHRLVVFRVNAEDNFHNA